MNTIGIHKTISSPNSVLGEQQFKSHEQHNRGTTLFNPTHYQYVHVSTLQVQTPDGPPVAHCLSQVSHQVPVRTGIHRVPVPGVWRPPVGKSFVVFGGQHDVSAVKIMRKHRESKRPVSGRSVNEVRSRERHSLCTRSLEHVRPVPRVEELSVELGRKLRVAEPGRVVL